MNLGFDIYLCLYSRHHAILQKTPVPVFTRTGATYFLSATKKGGIVPPFTVANNIHRIQLVVQHTTVIKSCGNVEQKQHQSSVGVVSSCLSSG